MPLVARSADGPETRATPTTRARQRGRRTRNERGLSFSRVRRRDPALRGGQALWTPRPTRRGAPARRVGEMRASKDIIRYAGRDVRWEGPAWARRPRAMGNVDAATVPRRRCSRRARSRLAPRTRARVREGKPSAMMHRDKGVCRYNRPPRVGRRTRVSTVTHLVERTAGAAAMVIEADAILNFEKSKGVRCDGRVTSAPAGVLTPGCVRRACLSSRDLPDCPISFRPRGTGTARTLVLELISPNHPLNMPENRD